MITHYNIKDRRQTLRCEIESNLITLGEHCCRDYKKALLNGVENIMYHIDFFIEKSYGIKREIE